MSYSEIMKSTLDAAPATMHPDAAAVYDPLWSPDAPNLSKKGLVRLRLSAKRTNTDPEDRAEQADEIANRLVVGAYLHLSGVSLFNHQAFRIYYGAGITELADRRG